MHVLLITCINRLFAYCKGGNFNIHIWAYKCLKAHNHNMYFLSSTKIFEASKTNSVDPDQTAPVGAVRSGSTMFASMLVLNRHFKMQLFFWRF